MRGDRAVDIIGGFVGEAGEGEGGGEHGNTGKMADGR
jgi:hypothetical protein